MRSGSCLATLLFGLAGLANAGQMTGEVIIVIDGDTVLFKADTRPANSRAFTRIRLVGIDAPERGQPFGDQARSVLAEKVLGQAVTLDTVAVDVYGRTLATLRRDGEDINLALVTAGLAWAAPRTARESPLARAERDARADQRGLWHEAAPTPPWVWRRTTQPRTHD